MFFPCTPVRPTQRGCRFAPLAARPELAPSSCHQRPPDFFRGPSLGDLGGQHMDQSLNAWPHGFLCNAVDALRFFKLFAPSPAVLALEGVPRSHDVQAEELAFGICATVSGHQHSMFHLGVRMRLGSSGETSWEVYGNPERWGLVGLNANFAPLDKVALVLARPFLLGNKVHHFCVQVDLRSRKRAPARLSSFRPRVSAKSALRRPKTSCCFLRRQPGRSWQIPLETIPKCIFSCFVAAGVTLSRKYTPVLFWYQDEYCFAFFATATLGASSLGRSWQST